MNFAPYVGRIRALIAEGRVEMCNHTFSHPDLATLSDAQIRSELLENEAWIETTFGVTSRPFFRPPYGAYNTRVMQVAGELGFTRVVLWSGSFADSKPSTTPNDTLIAIHMEAAPGLIMLGHANYHSTCVELPEIVAYLTSKGLQTVTLSQLLGTP
jgi:peptidoglycan/xylan/chitin deacetylase (PgdA/CDA1 family)